LPAINIRAAGFWTMLFISALVFVSLYLFLNKKETVKRYFESLKQDKTGTTKKRNKKI